MNRILSFPLASLSFFVLILFVTLALVACVPSTCASDSDCAIDSVCLVDADGPRCTAIALPVRSEPDDDVSIDVEIVDNDADEADEADEADDADSNSSGIVLRDASTSLSPAARAGTIVMRPITVIVTRSPSTTSPNTNRSNP